MILYKHLHFNTQFHLLLHQPISTDIYTTNSEVKLQMTLVGYEYEKTNYTTTTKTQ
jgi:hypothetical protein